MPNEERGSREDEPRQEVFFREGNQDDIPVCARLAKDAWPAGASMGSAEQELLGMEGYMQYSLESSNWAEIAFTSEGVIGFLFGRIDRLPGKEALSGPRLGELPSVAARFLRRSRIDRNTIRLLWSLVMTEVKLSLKMPESDATVEMFIVDSRHRGKGVGSMLLDRFLRAAKDCGSSLVTVYTDELMSNWQFYEKRGFKRIATFYDNITSYYSGRDSLGIIYAMYLSAASGR
jgi:ribosomal protein S18 acetylase RimI-like enzyme